MINFLVKCVRKVGNNIFLTGTWKASIQRMHGNEK